MAAVSIDIDALESMIADLGAARDDVPGDAGTIRGALDGVLLSTGSVDPLAYGAAIWTWVEDSLMDLNRRLALARIIAGSTPGFGGTGVVSFDDVNVSTLTQAEVDAAADRAVALMDGYTPDGDDSDDIPAELVAILGANAHDPYFAQALAERLGPEQLDRFLGEVNIWWANQPSQGEEATQAFRHGYGEVLTGLGMALGLASQGTDELAVPGMVSQWDAYVRETGTAIGSGSVNRLALVIGRGTWSTDFLATLTTTVRELEGDIGPDHWATFGFTMPVEPVGPDITDNRIMLDPLAGLLAALQSNPEATRILFTTGETTVIETTVIETDGGQAEVNASLWHVIRHRGTDEDTAGQLVGAVQAAILAPPVEGAVAFQPDLAADLQGIGLALEREARIAEEEAGPWWSQLGHALLDVVGLVPLLGEPADGLNGLWYLAEGNYVDAGLSFGGMVPVAGWFVQGGKWVRRTLNAGELAELGRLADSGQDLSRYLLPGGRLVDDAAQLADPANFRADRFLTEAELLRFGNRPWLQRIVAGNRFDDYMASRYPFNEVYLEYPWGRYVRLDSYVPGEAIVSRKLTQLGEIQPATGMGYIDELVASYPQGARIADVDSTRRWASPVRSSTA